MMSKKTVKMDVIVNEIKKRNQSDGYVKRFMNAPYPYPNLTKKDESIIYERPYEQKLAEQNQPTDNKVSEEILEYFFQTCGFLKKNDNLKIVLIKVTLLNAFYRTTIDNINLVAVARYICSLGFDEMIDQNRGEPNYDLVERIAYHQKEKSIKIGNMDFVNIRAKTRNGIQMHLNNMYSFATKYCAWHQPDIYPIVDSYAKGVIYHLANNNKELKERLKEKRVTHAMLNDYRTYCHIYRELRTLLENKVHQKISLKELDICLWSLGAERNITA